MAGSKQVKTFVIVIFITYCCLYTLPLVQPVQKIALSYSVNNNRDTSKVDKINRLSKNGCLQTFRLSTMLKTKTGLNCTNSNDIRFRFRKTQKKLSMLSLDKDLRNYLLLTTDEKFVNSFRPKLQNRQVALLSIIVETFDKIMTEHGMTYFLYGGALIGSYRHHGLTPWDDDADVMVSFLHRASLYHLLDSLDMDLAVSYDSVHYWKLYHKDGEKIQGVTWKWPFLDIFFYNQNETHIWDISPQYSYFTFQKTTIFPLRRRPFMGLSLFAPNDVKTVLSRGYNISECDSGGYVHRWERKIRPKIVPCSWLHHLFPFVSRIDMNGGCNETLWYQGKILNLFFDWGVSC